MTRLYLAGAGLLAVAALAFGLWQAGAQSQRARIDAATSKARIETITETKGARDAAENLDDDSLIDALGRWLLPASRE